jgi:hypothetical protein
MSCIFDNKTKTGYDVRCKDTYLGCYDLEDAIKVRNDALLPKNWYNIDMFKESLGLSKFS